MSLYKKASESRLSTLARIGASATLASVAGVLMTLLDPTGHASAQVELRGDAAQGVIKFGTTDPRAAFDRPIWDHCKENGCQNATGQFSVSVYPKSDDCTALPTPHVCTWKLDGQFSGWATRKILAKALLQSIGEMQQNDAITRPKPEFDCTDTPNPKCRRSCTGESTTFANWLAPSFLRVSAWQGNDQQGSIEYTVSCQENFEPVCPAWFSKGLSELPLPERISGAAEVVKFYCDLTGS